MIAEMRIAVAFSAALIASTAVAEDAVHLKCTGTEFMPGFNDNRPWPATISLVVQSDFVQGDVVGGRITKSDDRSITFMGEQYVASTNDNWKTSTKRGVCIYGGIDRVTGKVGVLKTYGKCDQVNGPPREPSVIYSSFDLMCKVVKQLF